MRIAARYRRVSKSDGTMTAANQTPETDSKIAALGLTLDPAYDYLDEVSGWNPKARLQARDRLLRDVRAGLLRDAALVIWSLDRLSRRGIEDVLEVLRVLRENGVTVVSCKEAWLSAEMPPAVSELLTAVLAWAAKWESSRKSERCRAAYQRKKMEANGQPVKWGRPGRMLDLDLVQTLREQGLGIRRIARAVGASVGRVHKALTTGN
jgi:DNA invertase Pin-like site-specific DNA recombinase